MDGNAAAERIYGARAADREREIEPYRVDAREDLIETLLAGQSIGYGYRRMNLVEILVEWPGVDIAEPAKELVAALTAPGDATAALGDLQLWLRSVAERYLDAYPDRIETRAEEMLAAAREAYDKE